MDGWTGLFYMIKTCLLSLLSLKASLQQTSSRAPEFYAVSILSLLLCAHSAAQGVSVAALPLPACRLSEHSHAAKYNLQMRMYCFFFPQVTFLLSCGGL